MRSRRTTRLLVALVTLAGLSCAISAGAMQSRKRGAQVAVAERSAVLQELIEIAGDPAGQLPTTMPGAASTRVDVNALVRAAATTAHASDALASIEPGPANGSLGVSVSLRFEPLSLQQLVTFTHTLLRSDSRVHADSIDIGAAPASADRTERWSATMTLSVAP